MALKVRRVLQVGLTANRGGVESFVMNIYRNIDRSKIQFDFLVDHDKELPYEDEIKQLGGKVYHEYYNMKEETAGKSLKDFFQNHSEFEVVHVNLNNLNTYFRVLQIAKKQKIKIRIIHSHNNGYMFKYNFKQKLYELYAKLTMKMVASDFLACSEEAGIWMFGKSNKFEVIPNAIDIDKFVFDLNIRAKIRNELNIWPDEKVLGFVGSLNYQKDPVFLIEIMHELVIADDSYRLVILGQGYLIEEVNAKIDEYQLQNKVVIVGNVPNVNDYMQAMDIFVLPSKFEGFGIVLLEAQASGLKCVTSKGVVPESTNVTGEVTFVAKADGPMVWAETIRNTELNRIDSSKMKESEYNIKNLIDSISRIYCQN